MIANKNTRKKISRMNPLAQQIKLGELFPIVAQKVVESDDIDAVTGAVTVDIGAEYTAIIAVTAISDSGVVRVVESVDVNADDDLKLDIVVTDVAADDVITVTVV